MENVFGNVEERQRTCILLLDEVYVKPFLMYHGGTVFGKAVNKPNELANTVLGFYVVTFYGGPEFLLRMLPVSGLDAIFPFEETINNSVYRMQVGIYFNKAFLTVSNVPMTHRYLQFDFVHILKSIRNNWITEKTQELEFPEGNIIQTARWSDLLELYNTEKCNLVKPSRLTEVSVFPKPIERQKVSTHA